MKDAGHNSDIVTGDAQEGILDFSRLRKTFIEKAQEFSRELWTDYNLHDPGVTIIEYLCYALSDLSYRTSFPVPDLLADKDGVFESENHCFFSPKRILSRSPATANDFRRVVIDEVEEVQNVWIEPVSSPYAGKQLKGSYRVIILPANGAEIQAPGKEEALIEAVARVLNRYRVLGECFDEFKVLKPRYYSIETDIIISNEYRPEQLLADIYHCIARTLNPPINFSSEAELLKSGLTLAGIYDGPLLKRGIIVESELPRRKYEIDPVGIVKALSELPGVLYIKKFAIGYGNNKSSFEKIKVPADQYPVLRDPSEDMQGIRLFTDGWDVIVNKNLFSKIYSAKDAKQKTFITKLYSGTEEPLLKGTFVNSGEYHSIQEFFPVNYMIGRDGVEKWQPPERHAAAKQLKGYLLFFEQVIINYLAQLENLSRVFSCVPHRGESSYYFKTLDNVPGVQELLNFDSRNWQKAYLDRLEKIAETDETYRERRNRLLEHLLSRFNISVNRYPATLYRSCYGESSANLRDDNELNWLSDITLHLPEITGEAYRGKNYFPSADIKNDYPGFEGKMRTLLYIKNRRERLSSALKNITAKHGKENNKNGISIGNQPLSFFAEGLKWKNYRIEEEGDGFTLKFQNPLDKNKKPGTPGSDHWQVLGHYNKRSGAEDALQHLHKQLTDANTLSEGFHIVEHLLLFPPRTFPLFGFKVQSGNSVLLSNKPDEWSSAHERDRTIKKIICLCEATLERDRFFRELHKLCKVHTDDETAIKTVMQQVGKGLFSDMAAVSLRVKLWDNSEVAEDFDNSRITIVFPAWPARFQDKGFRRFTENLFRQHLPAHIRCNFEWLTPSRMLEFEEIYFNWVKAMRRSDWESYDFAGLLHNFLHE